MAVTHLNKIKISSYNLKISKSHIFRDIVWEIKFWLESPNQIKISDLMEWSMRKILVIISSFYDHHRRRYISGISWFYRLWLVLEFRSNRIQIKHVFYICVPIFKSKILKLNFGPKSQRISLHIFLIVAETKIAAIFTVVSCIKRNLILINVRKLLDVIELIFDANLSNYPVGGKLPKY